MHLHSLPDALIVVVLVLMWLALPYAAIETFGAEARDVVLPFHIGLAIFSVALSVLTLIKYRVSRSEAAGKMRRRESSDREREGSEKDSSCSNYEQQLICMHSVIVTESILRNSGTLGILDD